MGRCPGTSYGSSCSTPFGVSCSSTWFGRCARNLLAAGLPKPAIVLVSGVLFGVVHLPGALFYYWVVGRDPWLELMG